MEIYKISFMFYLLCFVGFFFQWSSNRGKKEKELKKKYFKKSFALGKVYK